MTGSAAVESLQERPTKLAGYSHEQRPIDYRVWGSGRLTVMIIASIHGDEPAGTTLVIGLEQQLAKGLQLRTGRKVLVVPVANPDGLAQGTRGNARSIDIDSNFPLEYHDGDRGLSRLEPETRALIELIERYTPDRIISIHQPLNCIGYDGPAMTSQLADAMSRASNLSVKNKNTQPGSLSAYTANVLSSPTITLELPGNLEGQGPRDLWEQFGDLLITAISHPEPHEALASAKQ